MILYRTQPKNATDFNIINLTTKENMWREISGNREDITTLITDGSVVDGMLTLSGYQNILVVTSFESTDYTGKLRDYRYRPIKSAGDHMLPLVHKFNESEGNLYVTKVRNSKNFYTDLYDRFDIASVDVDSYFRLDGDLKMKTDVKFDAVVLLGSESYKKGKFSASDVKKKFAKYCTEDFDLIDVYRNDRRTLSGGTKSITNQRERMIEAVNTPTKLYDARTGVNTRYFDEEFGDVFMRQKLMYLRLADNLDKMNEYYKVY